MYHTFLSYNSKDYDQVKIIYEYLHNSGLLVFFDKEEIGYGKSFQQIIDVALRESESILVIIGPNGSGPWQAEEQYAFQMLALNPASKKPIIPVLLPGTQIDPETLPLFLQQRQHFTFKKGLSDPNDLFDLVQAIPATVSASGRFERPLLRKEQDALLIGSLSFYNQNWEAYYERWRDNPPLGPMYTFLSELRRETKTPSILDAGCGPGHHGGLFAKEGSIVTGIDMCKPFLQIATKSNIKEARFLPADMRDLQKAFKARNIFDGIWACGSCLHTAREALAAQLDQFTAVLKPGGVLGISFQVDAPSVVQDDGRFFERYRENELQQIFDWHRYEIVNINTQISMRSTSDKRKVKRWFNVTAKLHPEKDKVLLREKPDAAADMPAPPQEHQ